ncbi:transposase [Bacteroides gallinaceum]|nr:transposase [Bacteroides gallinaceum]MDN0067805.1 transposase [Bacteroides gallinaceum]
MSRGKHIYVLDGYHMNLTEGFWNHIKRSIKGIYHLVTPKPFQKYYEEFVFPYNIRKQTDAEHFNDFSGSMASF